MKTLLQIIFWSIATPVLFIVAVVVIWAIYLIWQHERNPLYNNNASEFAPVVNPHPQYFMTIQGFIDPSLSKNLKLYINSYFMTMNNDCNFVENSFQGLVPRYRNITINVKPNEQGKYNLNIPLDYFQPGTCRWTIESIQFFSNAIPRGARPIAFFRAAIANFKMPEEEPVNEIACTQKLNCNFVKFGNFEHHLLITRNYDYQINYRRR